MEKLSSLNLSVNSDHVDPGFWYVDPPAKQALRVRAFAVKNTKG
jgi:hypothetical protein